MDISLATLAATVVGSFLVPFIKKGAHKIIENVSEGLGEGVADQSTVASPSDKAVLGQFEQHPDAAKSLIEAMLKEKLAQDSSLASELRELVKKAMPGGVSTGAQVHNANDVGIADARQADLSHSSGAQIIGLKVEGPTVKKD